jgi:hypothetical protein
MSTFFLLYKRLNLLPSFTGAVLDEKCLEKFIRMRTPFSVVIVIGFLLSCVKLLPMNFKFLVRDHHNNVIYEERLRAA